jgi:hypothetical protein
MPHREVGPPLPTKARWLRVKSERLAQIRDDFPGTEIDTASRDRLCDPEPLGLGTGEGRSCDVAIDIGTGAGGFIGGQLVRDLLAKGVPVRAVDKKQFDDWYFRSPEAENIIADLQLAESCDKVTRDVKHVYNLAADMAAWGSSRTTKRCACSRSSSTLKC